LNRDFELSFGHGFGKLISRAILDSPTFLNNNKKINFNVRSLRFQHLSTYKM